MTARGYARLGEEEKFYEKIAETIKTNNKYKRVISNFREFEKYKNKNKFKEALEGRFKK